MSDAVERQNLPFDTQHSYVFPPEEIVAPESNLVLALLEQLFDVKHAGTLDETQVAAESVPALHELTPDTV